MSQIHFGGSRSLPHGRLVAQVVLKTLSEGHRVRVGCAIGADAQVIRAALNYDPARLSVFASFASDGSGSWSGSATFDVFTALEAGADVSFSAGGPLSVPLVGRLMARSRAALSGCSACVFFLSAPSSPGSLAVAALAVRFQIPVFAFCSPGHPNAPRSCSGRWLAGDFCGFQCWRWQPAQSKFC
jgi:predicted Rossmann fold nucleotide-binding protein DprA/Smf involved in DNA uptake